MLIIYEAWCRDLYMALYSVLHIDLYMALCSVFHIDLYMALRADLHKGLYIDLFVIKYQNTRSFEMQDSKYFYKGRF